MRGPKLWLVCYDVCDDKRLRRVYRVMRGFGDHLQLSVFRCLLSDLQFATMKDRLARELKPTEDQVLFVPLGGPDGLPAKEMHTIGLPLVHPERVVRVVGP